MADGEIIPLVEDYNFSEFSDEDLQIDIEITQAIMDQIDRMVAENYEKIDLGNDVDRRARLITILNMEKTFRQDRMQALLAEQERREES